MHHHYAPRVYAIYGINTRGHGSPSRKSNSHPPPWISYCVLSLALAADMIKFFALAAFLATANGYLNHGPGLAAAPYYGHYNPVAAVPQQANFLKNYAVPAAVSSYVKSLAPSYETVEKPQVQLTKGVYATYRPTVTNLPANHGAAAAGHYAHAAYPLAARGPIFGPAATRAQPYVQLGYPHAPALPPMPYEPSHIAQLNYPW